MDSKILILRHGITEGNQKKWFYGATDISLCEEGRRKLREQRDNGFYPQVSGDVQFFTTGLKRTEETLKILFGDVEYRQIKDMQEMNFGDYECKPFDLLKDDELFLEWGYDETGEVKLPNAESRNEFRKRTSRGGRFLIKEHISKKVAVSVMICHGGVISSFMNELFDDGRTMWDWMPEPGCGYEILISNGKPKEYRAIGRIGDKLQTTIEEYEAEQSKNIEK
ncbi:MAG: histidine phosphatase family protein [Eubacterium sp.]|nr:histidine phosphatase family protein [Eubacterium sp.]